MNLNDYVNDAVELLKRLIETPSVSRDETAAANVMASYLDRWGLPYGREGQQPADGDAQRPHRHGEARKHVDAQPL